MFLPLPPPCPFSASGVRFAGFPQNIFQILPIQALLHQNYPIQFIMASSAFVCHKLIDDIIKRGGQHLSDRYIIKTCLSRAVLSNKKIVTNELVKHSGIKSEYCTINRQLSPDSQPQVIRKDEFMCKSVQKIKAKSKPKALFDSRKSMSISKIKNKKQITASTLPGKQSPSLQPKIKKASNSNLIELVDFKLINKFNAAEAKDSDEMRSKLLAKEQNEREQLVKSQEYQEKIILYEKKSKNNFKKELNSLGSEHTYHTDGKFMVFPEKNKQKSIANNFPLTMASMIKGQNQHKRHQSSRPAQQLLLNKQQINLPKESKVPESDSNCESKVQIKQGVYNNNDQRQTSSLNFINIKPGICFTEPSSGQSMRGERENSEEFSLVKQKKSTFSKFLTKDLRSKTDGFIDFKKDEGKKFSLTAKTQFYNDHTDYDKYEIVASRRYKTMRSNRMEGKITNINEGLLQRLIGH